MAQSIFINMPVADLTKSVEFFKELGFQVKEQFTGENNACMQVGENIFAMLTKKEQFAKIIDKPVADKGTTEVLISVGLNSAGDVRRVTESALSQGARRISEPEDIGFMFSWGFEDLDGHIWDLFWMDPERLK